MNIDLIRSLPISQVIVASFGVASAFAVLIGWLLMRSRSRKRRTSACQAPGPAGYRPERTTVSKQGEKELVRLVTFLTSAVDRLDQAVISCLELSGKIDRKNVNGGEGVRILCSPPPDLDELGGRIQEMKKCGIGETDIASRFNLSSEQLKLYMHVGRKKKKPAAVSV